MEYGTESISISEFVTRTGVVMTSERVSNNPNFDDFKGDHYKVKLTRKDENGKVKRTSIYFSKGYGHQGKYPELNEVLECLSSDVTAIDRDFDEWCGDYGYDSDSIKHKKIFENCVKLARKLVKFFGKENIEILSYGIDFNL